MKSKSQSDSERILRATAIFPLAIFIGAVWMLPRISAGAAYRYAAPWAPTLGVELSCLVDGLSLLMILIISGVGFFVSLYSADYLHGHHHLGRFYFFLHAFMLSMLGIVIADNLMALFVAWELTTIFSYLLIGFEHDQEDSRASARMALLVTGAGGMAMLVGFLLLRIAADTFEISRMVAVASQIQTHSFYGAILITIVIGAFTKSAQFPFHFWLPRAMAAPTPISAFLHSATMVKGGIYLLARFHPILGGTPQWTTLLIVTGAITAVGGAIMSTGESDLKKILAYTTLMALGILTMFLGGSATPSLTAAMTFLLVHALYKSSLFLVAGIIDHQAGSRQVEKLGGLLDVMPFTAFAAFAAGLSMAGFPLFFGFIGKEIMYKGALAEPILSGLATTAAVCANALMVAVAGILMVKPFLGRRGRYPGPVREATVSMWCGPVVLGGLGILFGIIPDWVATWLIEPAVRSFHFTTDTIELSLFHGINLPLLLSVITLGGGIAIYLAQRPVRRVVQWGGERLPVSGSRMYDLIIEGIYRLGNLQNHLIQNGSLHRYFLMVAATFIITTGYSFLSRTAKFPAPVFQMLAWREWMIALIIMAAVGMVITARSRLLAISALGIVGASCALIFLNFGAPDVALTQLLVETLTLIIASIVLLRMPGLTAAPVRKTLTRKLMDGVLATSAGILITTLLLAVLTTNLDRSITRFYEQQSYLAAHGRNIVNVILVDFRSMDTLGEIIVVATAGLAGYALILNGGRK